MRKTIFVGALCLGLAGCNGVSGLAVTATRAALPPETIEKIAGLCRVGEPFIGLAAAAPFPADSSLKTITSYLAGYCGQMLAGAVPPTTDGNTISWLTQNIGTLRALLGR